jgi:hypothetical protein
MSGKFDKKRLAFLEGEAYNLERNNGMIVFRAG